jgi:hypothetical protein
MIACDDGYLGTCAQEAAAQEYESNHPQIVSGGSNGSSKNILSTFNYNPNLPEVPVYQTPGYDLLGGVQITYSPGITIDNGSSK